MRTESTESMWARLGIAVGTAILSGFLLLVGFYALVIFAPLSPVIVVLTVAGTCKAMSRFGTIAAIMTAVLFVILVIIGVKNEFANPGGYPLAIAWAVGLIAIAVLSGTKLWVTTPIVLLVLAGGVVYANNRIPAQQLEQQTRATRGEWNNLEIPLYEVTIPGMHLTAAELGYWNSPSESRNVAWYQQFKNQDGATLLVQAVKNQNETRSQVCVYIQRVGVGPCLLPTGDLVERDNVLIPSEDLSTIVALKRTTHEQLEKRLADG